MSDILIFENEDGEIRVDVLLDGDTVWLTQQQMVDLFDTSRTNIVEHLQRIYQDGELEKEATCRNFRQVRREGSREVVRQVPHFNLDAIISVGYRVNSKRGIMFRRWATKRLEEYLVRGFAVDQRRVAEAGLAEAKQAIELLTRALGRERGLSAESRKVLDIVSSYAKTWTTLLQYDEDALPIPDGQPPIQVLDYATARRDIDQLKESLARNGEASGLFGLERDEAFEGILGNIEQTMFGDPLYRSAEEKAANLLYFVIKDHPFSDGNKRIASFMFLRYMQEQDIPLDISPDALTALALLVANSEPSDKDLMIRLTMNSITDHRARTLDMTGDDEPQPVCRTP